MYMIDDSEDDLSSWIKKEIQFPGNISKGKRGMAAKRVQEWLCLHGNQVVVDSDFGSVTKDAVEAFQRDAGLDVSGTIDQATHLQLVGPMRSVLSFKADAESSFGEAAIAVAKAHLAQHPREVGGANRGPWVRMYMKGNEGTPWAWCAGFTTFCMHQASDALSQSSPIKGSFSCDSLAAQAKEAEIFLSESNASHEDIPLGSMFLVRRTSTDWTHVGFVSHSSATSYTTIEGNTNDDGDREGYEVCARRRGYSSKDFIIL
jgi:hypothetical protein